MDRHLSGLTGIVEPPSPGSPRERILLAAQDLFAQQGFAATSIRQIAGAAGVNLAMVHYYFGSKEILYRGVITTNLLKVFQTIGEAFSSDLPPEEILVQIPIRLATLMRNEPVWTQLMRRELAEGAPNARLIFKEMGDSGPKGFRNLLTDLYQEAVSAGKVKPLRPMALLPLLITLGYGLVLFDPIVSVVTEEEISDEAIWNDRMDVIRILLRDGLLTGIKDS
jgi:TetR/AcrR family transcriptional regulator